MARWKLKGTRQLSQASIVRDCFGSQGFTLNSKVGWGNRAFWRCQLLRHAQSPFKLSVHTLLGRCRCP